jgi:hypothetical protein
MTGLADIKETRKLCCKILVKRRKMASKNMSVGLADSKSLLIDYFWVINCKTTLN